MRILDIPASDIETALRVVEACRDDLVEITAKKLREDGITDRGFLNSYDWAEHVGNTADYLRKMKAISEGLE